MARDSSFLQYMRAHGNTPGPTQRPLLTGAVSGLLAFLPFELVLELSGARLSIAHGFGVSLWSSMGINGMIMIIAGMLYATIFKRAANDFHGGWMFGASFGFLLWMIAPVSLWQLITARPMAVGAAAMGLFGAHVLFGLALGAVFPWIHWLIQSRLNDTGGDTSAHRSGESVADPASRVKNSAI